MFVHPYSWEWREAQSTDGNMGRRLMSYRVWNSHDCCSDLRIFLTSFHFGPHPQPHNERQLRKEEVTAGVALWKQRSQEVPRSFYTTLALALSPPL